MSNFKKAFSFRNGVQVDTDNFVVTTAGLVGIGTTIPTEYFHVLGNAKFEDNINIGSVVVNGIGTFGQVKLGAAITMSADSGIITATAFYGDGATLSNLPTSQWQDVDPGLGFTSIYAVGNVGVGTDDPTGNYVFQVGSDPSTEDLLPGVGIGSDGNAHYSGIITAFGGVDLGGISQIESVTIDADGSTGVNAPFIVGDNKVRVRADVGDLYSQGSITLGVGYPSTSSGVVLNPNGTSQFNGPVTISSDATITGLTTTDTFYSAGISTFADSVEIVGNAGIGSLRVSGVTTFGPGLAGDEGDVDFQHNGATRAYWDSSAGTLNFKDGDGITLGTDEDFSISFDGSNTYLTNKSTNGASDLYIQSDEILLRRYDGGQTMAQFTEGGSVKLNYAGVTKIQTTQGGAIVSGGLSVSGVATVGILTSTGAAVIDGININAKSSTNTHIGKLAGNALTGGQQNVALGMYALLNNTNSNFNTAVGMQALGALGSITSSASDRNTAVGSYCGAQLTTGVSNTFLGASAGSEITTGSWNTIVGRYDGNMSELDVRTSSNNVILSDGEGNIRFYANSNGNVGLGSTQPTTRLDVVGNVRVSGSSTISGSISVNSGVATLGLGNSSSILKFVSNDKSFNITNNETGNINMYLHNGDVGVSTGRFDWIYGQTNQELMSLNYDGKLGLGKTNPDNTLHVVGTSTVTGNAWFGGDVTISGTLNSDSITLPSIITSSNILSSSGVSTFFDISVTNNISVASSIGIGTSTPIVSIDAQNSSALFANVGINTDIEPEVPLKVSGQSIFDSVGIGTTSSLGEGLYLQGSSFVQRNATMSLYDSVAYIQGNGAIGVGTTAVRCQIDFADAGKDATEINPGEGTGARAFMLPPRLTNAQRAGLTTEAGAFIFNLDEAKFQGYTGVAWTDFH